MNILIISRGVPTKEEPMWGNFELDQAKALKDKGNKVVIMSIDGRFRLYRRTVGVSRVVVEGIPMYNYFSPIPFRRFPSFLRDRLLKQFTKKLFAHILKSEGKFDVIHGHYLPNIRIATIIKEIYGFPVVGTEHWSALKKENIKPSIKKLAEDSYEKVDKLITVSYPLQQKISKTFGVDSEFIGCVVDNVFGYTPKKADGIFRFIAVGSLFEIKGFDVAIKAFARANLGKDIYFSIIGEGNQRANLEKLILSLGMEDRIFLEGRKTRYEIMEFLSKSSAYVLSSHSENFATACMEALSAGLPAIMTKCGGPEDFVDETNSILVEANNPDRMAEAMKYMVENIDKFDRKSISINIKAQYSAEAIAGQLSDIYYKVIK